MSNTPERILAIKTGCEDTMSTLNDVLVNELRAKAAISTPQVEAAFRAIPRHLFVPDVSLEEAYSNFPIPTKFQDGRPISSSSEPAIMAIMLEQLDLKPGHKVLEIGAGTGYNAALMAHIVGPTGEVITVDIDEDIVASAKAHLSAAGMDRVHAICAEGGYGYSEAAPYDRIILTVGASDITPAWQQQLKPNGRLVLPLALQGVHQVVALAQADAHLVSISVKRGNFMMLRGDFAAASPNFVPLAADPNLSVQTPENRPIDGEALYRWLTGPSHDWDTGVTISPLDLGQFGNFGLWVAAHLPELSILVGNGDMVGRDIVPPLETVGGKNRYVATAFLLGDEGMAALMRSPGQPLPFTDPAHPYADGAPFRLYVRQFGADDSVVQRLMDVIKGWEEAGRPSTEQLYLRIYPKATGYIPGEDELVVDTQWNRFVVAWQRASN